MKIYTKTGDKGVTGLFGNVRISKSSERIHAIGTIDEANSTLGLFSGDGVLFDDVEYLQSMLFSVGADLSAPYGDEDYINRVSKEDVEYVEKRIDYYSEKLPPLKNFILPSGILHHARTVVRRAERHVINLGHVNPHVVMFLNRISDLLFVMARFHEIERGRGEREWKNQELQK